MEVPSASRAAIRVFLLPIPFHSFPILFPLVSSPLPSTYCSCFPAYDAQKVESGTLVPAGQRGVCKNWALNSPVSAEFLSSSYCN